jgi:hypothetical protein
VITQAQWQSVKNVAGNIQVAAAGVPNELILFQTQAANNIADLWLLRKAGKEPGATMAVGGPAEDAAYAWASDLIRRARAGLVSVKPVLANKISFELVSSGSSWPEMNRNWLIGAGVIGGSLLAYWAYKSTRKSK